MISIARAAIAAAALTFSCSAAQATVVGYNSQAAFQGALPVGYTLVNLDVAPYIAYAPGYHVEDTAPAASFLAAGIDFFGYNAWVANGQNFQTVLDRDRLLIHGAGAGGEITINFTTPVNGIGAYSNQVDFGRIRLFSGANLTGTFLGEVPFGAGGSGSFGGMTSTQAIGSAHFTCDGDYDLYCGVYDMQFGRFAAAVPEPSSWAMMITGVGTIGGTMRRRRKEAYRLAAA